jgi:hypothetical protein
VTDAIAITIDPADALLIDRPALREVLADAGLRLDDSDPHQWRVLPASQRPVWTPDDV